MQCGVYTSAASAPGGRGAADGARRGDGRHGLSTTLQLLRELHHLASEGNCGRYTVAVLLDKEKAFDRVWYDGLIHKLMDTPLPPAFIRVVVSFLQRRSFCVAVDVVLSAPRPIRAEISRGSYLSPELYVLYTDDIPTLRDHLENREDDVMLALIARQIEDEMAVNVNKKTALLTGSQCNMPDQLRLRGQAVEWKTCILYLGVHIDHSLRMIPQIDHVIQLGMPLARNGSTSVSRFKEFGRMLARRAFNRADADPYPSLHNLAPHYDRPTGYQLPRDLVSKAKGRLTDEHWTADETAKATLARTKMLLSRLDTDKEDSGDLINCDNASHLSKTNKLEKMIFILDKIEPVPESSPTTAPPPPSTACS
ncbi:RNA-directed DNA polymerase from mobile element jockey [Eumeta japonica]|uniref:RNA-directed DNA polymerase from mobile element jockey n=1 Tax=Eumeta variegata TaxID=151549 RepID=A0A4C2A3P4_EUMVA|nr:RNA-directed DNA polymerase from mobile element jockey [Eumeta japonica]